MPPYRKSPRLYARIDIPTIHTETCEVYCRACPDYRVTVANLQAARRLAWSHDVDHWRRRVSPSTSPPTRKARR